MDIYKYNEVKDFVATNLCRDKFCNNCKKVKQASRMSKYIPEIEKYKDRLYHITFTLPNCSGADLKKTIKKMSSSFRQLIRYINGTKKIKGIDFSQYGYKGAVRSLEITFNKDKYHPHYHTAFVFDNLELNKCIKNTYSIDYKNNREDRLFSEFEVLIQKIWYLVFNDIEVNKNNINSLELGYSCICDKFNDNDYAELFKYLTKETDQEKNVLTYDNFKTLYFSTHFLKQIQGYGCLFKINDNDINDLVNEEYENLKSFLTYFENPISKLEKPIDLLKATNYKVISRKKIYQYMKNL